MSNYVVIPTAALEAYRVANNLPDFRQRFGDHHELSPVKLHNRDAYALPVEVLSHPALGAARGPLAEAAIEELRPEDFEWWHNQDEEPTP